MKTEFISTAAHEFRTPLTTIRGFAQVLLEDGSLPEEERREFLTYIHDKAVALAGIVSDLLDVGRIESGQGLSLERAPCTPREMVREAAQAWKARPDRERFEVELEDPEEPLLVDRGKMGQVFDNLVSNAVKYSPSGSPVRICGQKREGNYLFAVEDRGVGMSSVEVAKVFDKFYRVDSSDTAVGGIGLGMSIVKNIVESHGGRIWVESSPGKGTTVRFALPLEGG